MLSRLSAIIFQKTRRKAVKCRSGLLVEMLWVKETAEGTDFFPAPQGFRFVVKETWKSEDGRTMGNFAVVDAGSLETGIIVVKKGHGRPKG
jgi:hypothetical protein